MGCVYMCVLFVSCVDGEDISISKALDVFFDERKTRTLLVFNRILKVTKLKGKMANFSLPI